MGEDPGTGDRVGRSSSTEPSFLPWLGTLLRAGARRDDAGPRGRLGPRRRRCQRREVWRAARGGDAVLSGVLHTLRRIPGLRAQIKGRGRSKLLLKCPLPTPEAAEWGRVRGPRLLE